MQLKKRKKEEEPEEESEEEEVVVKKKKKQVKEVKPVKPAEKPRPQPKKAPPKVFTHNLHTCDWVTVLCCISASPQPIKEGGGGG